MGKNAFRIGEAYGDLAAVGWFLITLAIMMAAPSVGEWLREVIP